MRGAKTPSINLGEIRRIGWRNWDPIGLSDGFEFGPQSCVDEYDGYLLHLASLLTRGSSRSDAAAYLCSVARGHMGLAVVDEVAAPADR